MKLYQSHLRQNVHSHYLKLPTVLINCFVLLLHVWTWCKPRENNGNAEVSSGTSIILIMLYFNRLEINLKNSKLTRPATVLACERQCAWWAVRQQVTSICSAAGRRPEGEQRAVLAEPGVCSHTDYLLFLQEQIKGIIISGEEEVT